MALTAELRRLVGAGCAAGRVVRRTNEEHRGVVATRQSAATLRTAVPKYAASAVVLHAHHVHDVLIVAGRALHGGLVVVGGSGYEEAIVLHKGRRVRAGHIDIALSIDCAVPVVLSAATNGGVEAHRVVVEVPGSAAAVGSEQGRNLVEGSVGARQGLIHLVLHHGALRPVAVVAAQAGHEAENIRRPSQQAGRQRLAVGSAIGLTGLD